MRKMSRDMRRMTDDELRAKLRNVVAALRPGHPSSELAELVADVMIDLRRIADAIEEIAGNG